MTQQTPGCRSRQLYIANSTEKREVSHCYNAAMRLLHTADWHLGDKLGRIDRTTDIRRAVERVAAYCHDERIDVLLVAGDLFSELARPDGLREAVHHLRDTFGPFLHAGGTILAVTGNHDNETFCETLCDAMSLAAPASAATGQCAQPGRLYLATEPTLIRLSDAAFQRDVQFVLMPYPTPAVFLSGDDAPRYENLAQKNQLLRSAFNDRLAGLLSDPSIDRNRPSILMAHVGVTGADLSNRFRITEDTDIVIDERDWARQFAYVALGHVHKPQAVGGHAHIRYSGSIERLDLGESADRKSVVVVDLQAGGAITVTQKPLDATPIYRVEMVDAAAELPRLTASHSDRESALVSLRFAYHSGRDDLLEVQRLVEKAFPRWYVREFYDRAETGPSLAAADGQGASFESTVRDYLTANLVNLPDAERCALLDLADRCMQTISGTSGVPEQPAALPAG